MPEFGFTKRVTNFRGFLVHMETQTGKSFQADPLWGTVYYDDVDTPGNLRINATDDSFTQQQLQGFLDSFVDEVNSFKLASDKPLDYDKVPKAAANGVDVHTITIQKIDPDGNDVNSGSEALKARPRFPIPLSTLDPSFVNGVATFTVGGISTPCDVDIEVDDPSGGLGKKTIRLRFGP